MQLYQPTITGSLLISGSIVATGGITVSGSIASASFAASASNAVNAATASFVTLAQTASFVTTAQTASFVTTAQTASFVTTAQTASFVANAQSASNAVTAQTASYANALTVAGTLTAQTLVVQTITSSVDFVTGSTRFGSLSSNTHTFTGSVLISGSTVIGNRLNPAASYALEIYANDARAVVQDNANGTAGFFMRVVSGSTQVGSATVRTDNTGTFTIFSGTSSESARIIINSIGAVGIGVTPTSGWGSSTKVVQIGSGSLYNDSFNNTLIATNAYFNGSNNIHIATGPALRYYQEISNGEHYFQVAPSKVSGSAVDYTSSLYIKNNGNIGVNTTSPLVKLHVVGGNENGIRSIVGGTFSPIQFSGDNNITSGSINAYNGIIAIGRTTSAGTGLLPDVAINSSGNVGIGTTNPSVVFNVSDPNHGIGIAYRGSSALPSIAGLFTDTGVSGGSGYGDLLVKARTDYGGYYGVNFYTAASDNVPVLRMRVQSDGVLSLLSGQLKFPATQNPSSDANTLDDYEEGTINITTLTDGSATLTQFIDNRTLSYTKIGNRVYVNGNIYNQSISGTWSNPLRIPLPFTAASGDGRNRSYGAAALYNWGSTSDNIYLIEAGGTYASLVSAGSGGTWGTITTSSGFTAVVNFSYITA